MKVLVTSGMYESSYALVHALASSGAQVHVAYCGQASDVVRSRHVRSAVRVPSPPSADDSVNGGSDGPDPFSTAVLEFAARVGADAVVPTVDDELVALAVNAAVIREATGAVCAVPSVSTITSSMDKYTAVRTAERAGLVVPRTELTDSLRGVQDWARELGLPLFLKRRYSSGTHGVELVRTFDALGDAHRRLGGGEVVVQSPVSGTREPSVSLIRSRDGSVGLVVALRKRRYLNNSVSTAIHVTEPLSETEAVLDYFHAIDHVGFGAMQLRQDAEGRHAFIESNLRWGANSRMLIPLLRRQGYDAVGAFIAAHKGESLRRFVPASGSAVSPVEDLLAVGSLVAAARIGRWRDASVKDITTSYWRDYARRPAPVLDSLTGALVRDPGAAWTTVARAIRERGTRDYSFLPLGDLLADPRAPRSPSSSTETRTSS